MYCTDPQLAALRNAALSCAAPPCTVLYRATLCCLVLHRWHQWELRARLRTQPMAKVWAKAVASSSKVRTGSRARCRAKVGTEATALRPLRRAEVGTRSKLWQWRLWRQQRLVLCHSVLHCTTLCCALLP